MSIAMARGQVDEAMRLLEDCRRDDWRVGLAYKAIERARDFLAAASAAGAARVPLAHYAPITDEEAKESSP